MSLDWDNAHANPSKTADTHIDIDADTANAANAITGLVDSGDPVDIVKEMKLTIDSICRWILV